MEKMMDWKMIDTAKINLHAVVRLLGLVVLQN